MSFKIYIYFLGGNREQNKNCTITKFGTDMQIPSSKLHKSISRYLKKLINTNIYCSDFMYILLLADTVEAEKENAYKLPFPIMSPRMSPRMSPKPSPLTIKCK